MVIIPIGNYDNALSAYNALSPFGTYGWNGDMFSHRCLCCQQYAEFFWLTVNANNINEVARLFGFTLSSPPFLGIILCNSQVPFQVINAQSDNQYNINNQSFFVIEYNGHLYYAAPVTTNDSGVKEALVGIYNDTKYATISDGLADSSIRPIVQAYSITYHYTNSTVSGPTEAAVGDTVTVSAVPDVGYGITDASAQILVTNNDIAVPYTWDAANQRITFTMPDPS